jgi:hypothetical protein
MLLFDLCNLLVMTLGCRSMFDLTNQKGVPNLNCTLAVALLLKRFRSIQTTVFQKDLFTSWMIREELSNIIYFSIDQKPAISITGVFGVFCPGNPARHLMI